MMRDPESHWRRWTTTWRQQARDEPNRNERTRDTDDHAGDGVDEAQLHHFTVFRMVEPSRDRENFRRRRRPRR